MLELLAPVLTIVIGYLVKKALVALKIELDEKTYNAIVAGIVVYLLALLGVQTAARFM